jgi:putative MATE family efflux protein
MEKPLSLTADSIMRLTWRIAMPMSVGMFFNTMFNVVDTLCAGWLGTDALAALSLSFPVFFVIIAVGSGINQGATALMANAFGGGDHHEAQRVFAQSLVFTVAVTPFLSVAGLIVSPWLFRQLGAEGEYLHTVLAYMNVTLAGGIFYLLPSVINCALAAQGETRVFRDFLFLGLVANVALNPLLMWGWLGLPAMGVAGIGLATVIIQMGGCVFMWRAAAKTDLVRGIKASDFRPDLAVIRRITGQALPAALNMLTVGLGIFVITWFVKHFGKEAVAASGIATRIEQIVLMPAIGLNAAVLTIVGHNHGASLPHRVRQAWMLNIKLGHPCGVSHPLRHGLCHAGDQTAHLWIVDRPLPAGRRAHRGVQCAGVRDGLGALGRVVGDQPRDMERRVVRARLGMDADRAAWH